MIKKEGRTRKPKFASIPQVNCIMRNLEKKEYSAIGKILFIRKPIKDEELINQVNRIMSLA